MIAQGWLHSSSGMGLSVFVDGFEVREIVVDAVKDALCWLGIKKASFRLIVRQQVVDLPRLIQDCQSGQGLTGRVVNWIRYIAS